MNEAVSFLDYPAQPQPEEDLWIEAYTNHTPFSEIAAPAACVKSTAPALAFSFHHTTKKGSLVLVLIDLRTGEEVCAFFNVDVAVQRGKNRGAYHRTGINGQFFPEPRSKFRKFWMRVIGREPLRWATAFKELRPRLKGLVLTADLTPAYRSTREVYLKADNLQLHGTTLEQFGNIFGTSRQQEKGTRIYCKSNGYKASSRIKVHGTKSAQEHNNT